MKNSTICFLLVFSLVGVAASSGISQQESTKHQSAGTCPRSEAIEAFKKAVIANGGTVDSPHVSGGIAVVAITSDKAKSAAIQKAAADYLAHVKALGPDKGTNPCSKLSQAIAAGTIKESMTPFGSGVLFLITSSDKNLEKLIQEGDCCQWCGPCGSHSTAGCCTRCG